MAWNEPGGSNGRDPWGGRNEQGPPDLDELLRKLQRRLAGLFGGGRGGAGSGTGGSGGGIALVLLAVLAVGLWVLSGFYIIDEGKRGVVLQFGAYKETTLPGLRWVPRYIQSVDIVDFDRIKIVDLGMRNEEALMLTRDENIVDVKFSVQYKVRDPREYLFNVRDADITLRQATEAAVREVIGKNQLDFVLTEGRTEVANRVMKVVQEILDGYKAGLLITSVNMQDAQAPEQVQGAFADAVKAREDEQRLINEAQAYSNDVLPRAGGRAARILEEANAYKESVIVRAEGEASRFLAVLGQYQKAPEVTRRRIYIEALESLLSRAPKVLIDSASSNIFYLPLDRTGDGRAPPLPADAARAAPPVVPGNEAAPRVSDPRQRDNQRRREVR